MGARRKYSKEFKQEAVEMTKVAEVSVSQVAGEVHRLGRRCSSWGWHDNTTKDVDPETSQGDAYATYGWVDADSFRCHLSHDGGHSLAHLARSGIDSGGAVLGHLDIGRADIGPAEPIADAIIHAADPESALLHGWLNLRL